MQVATHIKRIRNLILILIIFSLIYEFFSMPYNVDKYDKNVKAIRRLAQGKPDIKTGEKLEEWSPELGMNPDELGSNYYQGDILHPLIDPNNENEDLRNGLADLNFRWPNGVIPYKIVGNFTNVQLIFIEEAMNAYHRRTCIKFRPYIEEIDKDYVSILNTKTGCWSYIGRIGGEQFLNLQAPGCFWAVGVAIHELMHAVGFYHEHSRPDRDDFINIIWDNIVTGQEDNFAISQNSTTFDVTYDYLSVMHYSYKSFSNNGLNTIQPKAKRVYIGQRSRLSKKDIAKIRIMYRCAGRASTLKKENPNKNM